MRNRDFDLRITGLLRSHFALGRHKVFSVRPKCIWTRGERRVRLFHPPFRGEARRECGLHPALDGCARERLRDQIVEDPAGNRIGRPVIVPSRRPAIRKQPARSARARQRGQADPARGAAPRLRPGVRNNNGLLQAQLSMTRAATFACNASVSDPTAGRSEGVAHAGPVIGRRRDTCPSRAAR